MSDEYYELIDRPYSFNHARHVVLMEHGYTVGHDHPNGIKWFAPFDSATPRTLDEAWDHFLELLWLAFASR